MILGNIIAIAQKELQNYFTTPFAYILAAVFWFISGFFFVEILIGDRGIVQQVLQQEQAGVDLGSIDIATEFLNSYLSILGTLSLLIIPVLSMGLYTEEKKQGTLELLVTSPITNWVVALGKLIAVTFLFIFMLLPSFLYEAIAFSAVDLPLSLMVPLLAHIGLILMSTALLSIGMFISSLTNSNILAAISTFSVILFSWGIDLIANNIGGIIGERIEYLSLLQSYNNLVIGIVNISDVILFLSFIFVGLLLTATSVRLFCLNHQ